MGYILPIILMLVVAGAYFTVASRRLKNLKAERMRAFSDIDAQLRLRFHLIPELINATSHYATNENALIEQVRQAQMDVSQSRAIRERIKAEMSLEHAMKGLMAAFASHPELSTNEHYQKLTRELEDIQSHILDASYDFNYLSDMYNNTITTFPENLLAQATNLYALALYPIAPEPGQAPAAPAPPISE